jgi:hypothetical protein
MTVEEGLYAYLSTFAGLTALVADRVYPQKKPQGNSFPQVSFFLVSEPRDHTLMGATGLPTARVQLDCWGLIYPDAKAVAEQVRLALDGYRGLMGAVTVQCARVTDRHDDYLSPANKDDVGTHRVIVEAWVSYQETVPTFS